MRYCAVETRIGAETEVRILLAKADAVLRETLQVSADLQAQVCGLHEGRRDLVSRLGRTVPAAELRACQAEASALREAKDGLDQQLRVARGDAEDLRGKMQVVCSALQGCLALRVGVSCCTPDA
jgi:hypothetical protein